MQISFWGSKLGRLGSRFGSIRAFRLHIYCLLLLRATEYAKLIFWGVTLVGLAVAFKLGGWVRVSASERTAGHLPHVSGSRTRRLNRGPWASSPPQRGWRGPASGTTAPGPGGLFGLGRPVHRPSALSISDRHSGPNRNPRYASYPPKMNPKDESQPRILLMHRKDES
jgi:hypothetical protein